MKNLITISSIMIVENGLVTILRFFVGLKAFLSFDESKSAALFNFVLPVIFAIVWFNLRDISSEKNGFYGASLSLMTKYEEELNSMKNNRDQPLSE